MKSKGILETILKVLRLEVFYQERLMGKRHRKYWAGHDLEGSHRGKNKSGGSAGFKTGSKNVGGFSDQEIKNSASSTSESYSRPTTPKLRFTPYSWAKLRFMRDKGSTEVGGFGISKSLDDLLTITDIAMVKQECTAAFVEFDDIAVADHFESQHEAGRQPAQVGRIWIHTHPGNSASPSGTDENTFSRVFGKCDWAIMLILARGGELYARLRYNVGVKSEMELPVEIDYSTEFPGSDHAAWTTQYTACVNEKKYTYQSSYGSGYSYNGRHDDSAEEHWRQYTGAGYGSSLGTAYPYSFRASDGMHVNVPALGKRIESKYPFSKDGRIIFPLLEDAKTKIVQKEDNKYILRCGGEKVAESWYLIDTEGKLVASEAKTYNTPTTSSAKTDDDSKNFEYVLDLPDPTEEHPQPLDLWLDGLETEELQEYYLTTLKIKREASHDYICFWKKGADGKNWLHPRRVTAAHMRRIRSDFFELVHRNKFVRREIQKTDTLLNEAGAVQEEIHKQLELVDNKPGGIYRYPSSVKPESGGFAPDPTAVPTTPSDPPKQEKGKVIVVGSLPDIPPSSLEGSQRRDEAAISDDDLIYGPMID